MAAAALFTAVSCAEDPDTGNPDEPGTEEPGTEEPDSPGTEDNTGLISLITIRNDEGDEHYWGFTYDSPAERHSSTSIRLTIPTATSSSTMTLSA